MDPWRLATKAQRRINALAGTALASCVLAWLAGLGSAPIQQVSASVERTGAVPAVERSAPAVVVNVAPADPPQIDTPQKIVLASADTAEIIVPAAPESVMKKVAETAAQLATYEPISLFEISPIDSAQVLPPEPPSTELAMITPADAVADNPQPGVPILEINEECLVAEICIDRYLWTLYERAPKIDAIAVHERRKVTIKRKGKMRTVTRTFTKRVDQDFTWKDPKAAERAGMTMMDYVIGGMDRTFKLKLFHTLHAAEQAGLHPGITSAFRDDYRQSIASGLKAASDRSYHGGSTRGGYGHGLAADIVSVKGATRAQRWVSTEKLWKWIDANGKDFGIGRPYLDRDPPHVAPMDGREYVSRRGGAKTEVAEAKGKKTEVAETKAKDRKKHVAETKAKKNSRQAARDDRSKAKHGKTAKIAKGAKTAKLARARTM
ncbi:peptidase M15 [Bradyrhizobium sp. CB3481]|uniref:peptidase M15 n=1 Tax=Bradyrhizobium sp. CB3481 TaxID=3039158 RepID=UPI0024B0AB78|nr:peptidase M15 [Bradyrhizobium sp. CB3481]WFU15412.1 peptidase M15 [Bradyrhizobium sp. CB3481]